MDDFRASECMSPHVSRGHKGLSLAPTVCMDTKGLAKSVGDEGTVPLPNIVN
jgi:tetraacyldisaccharide-1-P 4'-kinase